MKHSPSGRRLCRICRNRRSGASSVRGKRHANMAAGVRKGTTRQQRRPALRLQRSPRPRTARSAARPSSPSPRTRNCAAKYRSARRPPVDSSSVSRLAIHHIQIFAIVDARHSAHPLLKLHLVTAAQRGYSSGLLEVYGTKFASRRFLKRTARPSYALKDAVPNRAARILFAEAMNTFDKCYADLGTASSVRAHWRCG